MIYYTWTQRFPHFAFCLLALAIVTTPHLLGDKSSLLAWDDGRHQIEEAGTLPMASNSTAPTVDVDDYEYSTDTHQYEGNGMYVEPGRRALRGTRHRLLQKWKKKNKYIPTGRAGKKLRKKVLGKKALKKKLKKKKKKIRQGLKRLVQKNKGDEIHLIRDRFVDFRGVGPNKEKKTKKAKKPKINRTTGEECHEQADYVIEATLTVTNMNNIDKRIGKLLNDLDFLTVICIEVEQVTVRRTSIGDNTARRTQTTQAFMSAWVNTDAATSLEEAVIGTLILSSLNNVVGIYGVSISEANQSARVRGRRTRANISSARRLKGRPETIDYVNQVQQDAIDAINEESHHLKGLDATPKAKAVILVDPSSSSKFSPTREKSKCFDHVENPCASSKHLESFLGDQDRSWNTFSKSNPLCESAAYNHIHVMIPFYNLPRDVINGAVFSVLGQDYQSDRLSTWLYDDASDDPSIISSACNGASFEFDPPTANDNSWVNMQQVVKTMGIKRNQDGLLCVRSTRHLGPGGGKYFLFGLVKAVAGPNDILLVLDGDDTLHRKDALKIVNQKYLDTGAFFTYGSYKGRWEEQIKDLPSGVREGKLDFRPRNQTWVYGHPRTFKAHLLNHITEKDFQHSDGSWLIKCTERGFVYRMLELAGPSRIGYIAEKIYSYKFSSTSSTLATVPAEVRAAMLNHTMTGMKPSQPLLDDLNVVLLAWKRIYLLTSQLIWLQNQIDLGNRRIHVHIVNNNWVESRAVDEAIDRFREWQISSKEMRNLLAQKDNAIRPIQVSVTHNDLDQVHHNFARFVYVDKLRRTAPLNEVVFLDDDQYWPPTFISTLLKNHRPKSISTWYGKTFQDEVAATAGTAELPSYWKPDAGLTDIITGKVKYNTFKYGGTGGSIFDTNLWLLDSQLLRPAKDLSSWAKIDDLWASYVLDALLGWNINRITNDVLPIDIGDFRKKKTYYNVMKTKVDKKIEDELIKFPIPSSGTAILNVATYADKSVDKQAMFDSLQTKFMWDIA